MHYEWTTPRKTKRGIVIASGTNKGGVGKTAITRAIAFFLSQINKKWNVLIIDFDSQNNHRTLNNLENSPGAYGVLLKDYSPQSVVAKVRPNIDIILSGGKNIEAFNRLPLAGRELIIKDKFEECCWHYDFIIVDTPPQITPLTANVAYFADYLISPTDMDITGIFGAKNACDNLESFRKRMNCAKFMGIVPNKYSKRRNNDNLILEQIRQWEENNHLHGGKCFKPIRESAQQNTANTKKKFIGEFIAPKVLDSDESIGANISFDYLDLTRDILSFIKKDRESKANSTPVNSVLANLTGNDVQPEVSL